jgi:hypothetical protein
MAEIYITSDLIFELSAVLIHFAYPSFLQHTTHECTFSNFASNTYSTDWRAFIAPIPQRVSEKPRLNPPKSPLKSYHVYTSRLDFFLDLNPPNPLKKLAQIRILVPLFKGDLGGLTTYDRTFQTSSHYSGIPIRDRSPGTTTPIEYAAMWWDLKNSIDSLTAAAGTITT